MSLIRAKDVDIDGPLGRIYKAFLSNKVDQLRATDKALLTRMRRVDTLVREKKLHEEKRYNSEGVQFPFSFRRPYKKREIVEWLQSEFGVSIRQAYLDVEMAQRFFHSFETSQDREIARGMAIETGEEMMARAEAAGDFRAAAAFYKELNQIKQLRTFQMDLLDPSEYIPTDPILVDDPSKLGFPALDEPVEDVKARLMKKLKKGFIETMVEDAETVDDENVEEEEI